MKSDNNIILGIDTSCYTTSIAAISLDKSIIFNEKIMLKVKENSKGLRQSEAVFQHINNLGTLGDKLYNIMKMYNIKALCVSTKPRPTKDSYMPVFTVGYNFTKLIDSMLNCPLYETSHQENHIEASLFTSKLNKKNRFLSVHMSGGTTEILLVNEKDNGYNIEIVGGSKDISFGQLIDRIGVKLGYKFPAGIYLDEKAISCNEKIEQGLKTSVKEGYMNLSGLENQAEKLIGIKTAEYISKVVLDSIVKNMYKSLTYVCGEHNINEVVFAGGVSASKYIAKKLSEQLEKNNIDAHFTSSEYSTDNAVGCAIIGLNNFLKQQN